MMPIVRNTRTFVPSILTEGGTEVVDRPLPGGTLTGIFQDWGGTSTLVTINTIRGGVIPTIVRLDGGVRKRFLPTFFRMSRGVDGYWRANAHSRNTTDNIRAPDHRPGIRNTDSLELTMALPGEVLICYLGGGLGHHKFTFTEKTANIREIGDYDTFEAEYPWLWVCAPEPRAADGWWARPTMNIAPFTVIDTSAPDVGLGVLYVTYFYANGFMIPWPSYADVQEVSNPGIGGVHVQKTIRGSQVPLLSSNLNGFPDTSGSSATPLSARASILIDCENRGQRIHTLNPMAAGGTQRVTMELGHPLPSTLVNSEDREITVGVKTDSGESSWGYGLITRNPDADYYRIGWVSLTWVTGLVRGPAFIRPLTPVSSTNYAVSHTFTQEEMREAMPPGERRPVGGSGSSVGLSVMECYDYEPVIDGEWEWVDQPGSGGQWPPLRWVFHPSEDTRCKHFVNGTCPHTDDLLDDVDTSGIGAYPTKGGGTPHCFYVSGGHMYFAGGSHASFLDATINGGSPAPPWDDEWVEYGTIAEIYDVTYEDEQICYGCLPDDPDLWYDPDCEAWTNNSPIYDESIPPWYYEDRWCDEDGIGWRYRIYAWWMDFFAAPARLILSWSHSTAALPGAIHQVPELGRLPCPFDSSAIPALSLPSIPGKWVKEVDFLTPLPIDLVDGGYYSPDDFRDLWTGDFGGVIITWNATSKRIEITLRRAPTLRPMARRESYSQYDTNRGTRSLQVSVIDELGRFAATSWPVGRGIARSITRNSSGTTFVGCNPNNNGDSVLVHLVRHVFTGFYPSGVHRSDSGQTTHNYWKIRQRMFRVDITRPDTYIVYDEDEA